MLFHIKPKKSKNNTKFKLAIPYSHAEGVHDVLVQGFMIQVFIWWKIKDIHDELPMLAIQQGKTLYLCVQITIKIAIVGKIIIVWGSFIDFQRKVIIYF